MLSTMPLLTRAPRRTYGAAGKKETTMLRPKAFLQWAIDTFGSIACNRDERAARFVEEALELAHAEGMSPGTAMRLINRVYSRPRGDTAKEIGQAQATLECLAENLGLSADAEAEREFARVKGIPQEEWTRRHDAKVALQIANLSPIKDNSRC
jgi:uncharacterized protein with PIN domain